MNIAQSQMLLQVFYKHAAVGKYFIWQGTIKTWHNYIFVIGAIKDLDHSLGRNVCVDPPQKVMFQLFLGRFFKGFYLNALRVHTAKSMADGTVLA